MMMTKITTATTVTTTVGGELGIARGVADVNRHILGLRYFKYGASVFIVAMVLEAAVVNVAIG